MESVKCTGIAIVADDSTLICDLLRDGLKRMFAQVHVCRDGGEAVEAARLARAALVILDYKMRTVDGIEACRRIRALPGYATVPIVLLTGFKNERTERQAALAGATLTDEKPFNLDRIRGKLEKLGYTFASTTGLGEGCEILQLRREIEARTDAERIRQSEESSRVLPFSKRSRS